MSTLEVSNFSLTEILQFSLVAYESETLIISSLMKVIVI